MALHPALQAALDARGRTWGADNDAQLEAMRAEHRELRQHHPRYLALLLGIAFARHRPLGWSEGGYLRASTPLD